VQVQEMTVAQRKKYWAKRIVVQASDLMTPGAEGEGAHDEAQSVSMRNEGF